MTTGNVRGLKVAWEHHTGDLRGDGRTDRRNSRSRRRRSR
ncbi:hypothetical protein ACU4GR_05595 [Methylobacterium oryzae CBMB20]